MNISISSMLAGLLFSTIGIWMIKEAKRKSNIKLIPIAILLTGYSYFTSNPVFDWGVGLLLCAAAYMIWQ